MAVGRPVILGTPTALDTVKRAKAGITVPPDEPKKISEAIMTLKNMTKSHRNALGKNGYDYVMDNHTYTKIGELLEQTLIKNGG